MIAVCPPYDEARLATLEGCRRVGWTFEVPERHAGGPSTAEIVEVLDVPGYILFRVRWDDGSESTFIPSRDHRAHPPAASASL